MWVAVLVPFPFAGPVLIGPGRLVPQEDEVLLEVAPQPLMGADVERRPALVSAVLVGDRVEAQFPQEPPQLVGGAVRAHPPHRLRQRVAAAPGQHPEWAVVLLVGHPDDQVAARRVVPFPDGGHAPLLAAEDGSRSQVGRARPIANPLPGLVGKLPVLIRPLPEVGQVLFVGVDTVVDQAYPLRCVAAGAPPRRGDQTLDLEQVGMDEKPDQ